MIYDAIEKKRKKMMKYAKIHGFSSPKTVKCSQELDKLLNLVHKLDHSSQTKQICEL